MVKLKIHDNGRISFSYPCINSPVVVNGKSSWDSFEEFYEDYTADKTPTLPQFYRFQKEMDAVHVKQHKAQPVIEAVKVLEDYNRWRKGDESIGMIDPKIIGWAIDVVCEELRKNITEKDLKELSAT